MSCTLYYEPKRLKRNYISDHQIRDILRGTKELGRKDLSYLAGLRDGGHPEAQKLIDAIELHGELELTIEC